MSFIDSVKTTALMALLMTLVIGVFWYVGGEEFGFIGLLIGGVMNFGVYWYSDKIILTMTRAKEADRTHYPKLHEIVERLSRKADMPKPRVYVIKDPSLNAFATGRNPKHAAVAVHTGLLETLTTEEVEGVLGHELTHVKNRDTLISTLAAVIAGSLSYLMYAFMWGDRDNRNRSPLALVAVIVAPILAMLIRFAISRSREYSADAGGAQLSNPAYLASALHKISGSVKTRPIQHGNPATSHMYIINPFLGQDLASLFSTHPPTRERISRLRERTVDRI